MESNELKLEVNEAKEIFKQQIIDAYNNGFITSTSLMDKKAKGEYLTAEQYYNENYKQ